MLNKPILLVLIADTGDNGKNCSGPVYVFKSIVRLESKVRVPHSSVCTFKLSQVRQTFHAIVR